MRIGLNYLENFGFLIRVVCKFVLFYLVKMVDFNLIISVGIFNCLEVLIKEKDNF